ncbi:Fe-S cluster assembly protein SufD [Pontibacter sp. G13]|uniref:Fe-S cluster assembly protein SufD n=1 Tax=Pontibacter sp. G13 TaxID=3074898 RepID=UPI00288BBA8A|nr:Fe-S cluster assembly protein SufD [Pontibacter sp. G13]WNJ19550.1 Fe-S cluster assembly protein SufD [Pontibacter sp. G13]
MAITNEQQTAFVEQFRPASENGSTLAPSVRKAAEEALAGLSLPNRKTEAWKYTQLKSLPTRHLSFGQTASPKLEDAWKIEGLEADTLVFVNGVYQPEQSSLSLNGDALTVGSIKGASGKIKEVFEAHVAKVAESDADIFTALNTAYAQHGVLIHLAKNQIANHPVHIIHIGAGDQDLGVQTRNLFVLDANAEAKVVESFHTVEGTQQFVNEVTEISVGENAKLEYIKLQQEGDQASRVDRTEVHQDTYSKFSIFTFTFNGDIVRNNLFIHLNGEHTETHLMGAYLLSGTQHVDNFTQVHHKKPNCYSNELYKGIMHEQSTGVFNGKIHVYQDAQKTNAFQSNRNILLTDSANVFTKPQLEIYADDVKCSHGATTGRLDEEALFYLKARGIKEYDARMMLIHAFVMEVAEQISLEAVRDHLEQLVNDRY